MPPARVQAVRIGTPEANNPAPVALKLGETPDHHASRNAAMDHPDVPATTQGIPPALPIAECRRLTTAFLTGPMRDALRAVEYEVPDWSDGPGPALLSEASRAEVVLRHVPGASDAEYRITAFGERLRMRLQLNVWRFVIVYSVPAGTLVDVAGVAPRFERWRRGAMHAGWKVGWRDAVDPSDHGRQLVETYCYAMLGRDFLMDPMAQLYWRTDIVQMTRGFMLEAKRGGVRLSER